MNSFMHRDIKKYKTHIYDVFINKIFNKVMPRNMAKNLGVFLDSKLTLKGLCKTIPKSRYLCSHSTGPLG